MAYTLVPSNDLSFTQREERLATSGSHIAPSVTSPGFSKPPAASAQTPTSGGGPLVATGRHNHVSPALLSRGPLLFFPPDFSTSAHVHPGETHVYSDADAAAAAASLPIPEAEMLPSPISGTSPSSPSSYVLPLPPPPASSAASSPSVPLTPPHEPLIMSALLFGGDSDSSSGAASCARQLSMTLSLGAAAGGSACPEQPNANQAPCQLPALQRPKEIKPEPEPEVEPEPETEQVTTPLLSRYDPYHGTTCFVHHPLTQKPFSGAELRESLQRALSYGASQMSERLNHQDLAPTITGMDDGTLRAAESFADLLEKGNKWLEQNPQYSVRTCESVTWWTTEQVHVGDTEAVLMEQATAAGGPGDPGGSGTAPRADTVYLTGLRLWVVQREPDVPIQQIRVRDFHPTNEETLSHLVKRVNALLQDTPFHGSIVTIETVACADVNSHDCAVPLWRESQCKQGVHTLFLRIFYIEGAPKQETIGVKDFCPELTETGSDSFGTLVKNAKRWLNNDKNTRLINLRSIYITRHNDISPEESANRTKQQYYQFDLHPYITVLRLFYVRQPRPPGGATYQLINYVTFTPVQLLPGESTEVEYEKMRQTMVRVCAWIKAADAKVLCCESVVTPLCAHLPTQSLSELSRWETDTADSHISSNNVKKYLLHVRLFLEGEYRDPDPHALPPLPASLTAALQATLLEREHRHYRRKRKRRRRRRTLLIAVSAIVLSAIIAIIVIDQSLNFFGL